MSLPNYKIIAFKVKVEIKLQISIMKNMMLQASINLNRS
jgi:hypothetical protein